MMTPARRAEIEMNNKERKRNIVIDILMKNDSNATWYECKTIEELVESLESTMENYEEGEETYQLYMEMLNFI